MDRCTAPRHDAVVVDGNGLDVVQYSELDAVCSERIRSLLRAIRIRMRSSGSFPASALLSSPSPHIEPDADRSGMAGGTSPTDIQSHLYQAFLHGRTADVSLHVRGSWEGIYRLHRVVLIQADFFRLLFDGGFRESIAKQGSHDEVNVIFDDPNITRAAFEVCISRLYGGGPALYVDPVLVPSRREPLTPSFRRPAPLGDARAPTPRFLLSLLATATYLAMPSIVSQTLLLVLGSLGPHTVIRYLNFAIGKGIGEKGENELDAAVGLEDLCQEVRYPQTTRSSSLQSGVSKRTRTSVSQVLEEFSAPKKEEPTDTDSHSDDDDDVADEDDPAFLYGSVSNKIGEAAACWLCRWGADMLVYEETVDLNSFTSEQQQRAEPMRRRATAPVVAALAKDYVPQIWRRGGLSASWARAVLSADAFFVRDERERYDIARRVVELRRRCSIDLAEEKEWEDLFANGIHYMHMALEDLIDISQDVSPTLGRPYASASIIQAAHWDQSVLRHFITYRPNSSGPATPPRSPVPSRDGSLGLSKTTAEVLSELSAAPPGTVDPQKAYYPVPADSTSRIGDTTGLDGASMDQLFAADGSRLGAGKSSSNGKGHALNTPANFFGIGSERRSMSKYAEADVPGTAHWAPFPPIRFGVEFWGLVTLQEKARLTSQTIWYAGSLFNVYVQVVRKKGANTGTGSAAGIQLGMYLHRLSPVETIPLPSAPPLSPVRTHAHSHSQEENGTGSGLTTAQPVNIPTSISTPTLHRPHSHGTLAGPSRSTTPASPSSSSLSASPPSAASHLPSGYQYPLTGGARPPSQPYRDPRETVRAHFTLLCATPTGGALTRFASEPDAFHVGRSWGWKSSALQTEEHLGGGSDDYSANECSLRATVVLGIV